MFFVGIGWALVAMIHVFCGTTTTNINPASDFFSHANAIAVMARIRFIHNTPETGLKWPLLLFDLMNMVIVLGI